VKSNILRNSIFLVVGVLLIFIIACSSKTCESPMVKIGDKCCVDLDSNGICDLDETENKITGKTVKETTQESQVKIEKKQEPEKTPIEEELKIEEITTQEIESAVEQEQQTQEKETATVKIESPTEEIEPDIPTYQFIKKYENRGLGYQYIYNHNQNKIKGDRIRIKLELPKKIGQVTIKETYYPSFYIDTIYLNRKNNEALGYCEKDKYCFSKGLIDVPLRLNYADYKEKTPDEWLYEYAIKQPDLFEERKYYVEEKQTSRATYKTEQGEIRIYYDINIGLPVRIEKQIGEYPSTRMTYSDLTAGTVRDIDVIHRSKDEIPPEEAFYSTRS